MTDAPVPPCGRCQIEAHAQWVAVPAPVVVRCPTCDLGLCSHHAVESVDECPRCLMPWIPSEEQLKAARAVIRVVRTNQSPANPEVLQTCEAARAVGIAQVRVNRLCAVGRMRRHNDVLARDSARIAMADDGELVGGGVI